MNKTTNKMIKVQVVPYQIFTKELFEKLSCCYLIEL